MGLGALGPQELMQAESPDPTPKAIFGNQHHAAKAKRVIYLFMSGALLQLDLFDHKPLLNKMHGEELPDSVRQGRLLPPALSANFEPVFLWPGPPSSNFPSMGRGGMEISEILPYTSKIADDLCLIRSRNTAAI